jgi:MFS family permease
MQTTSQVKVWSRDLLLLFGTAVLAWNSHYLLVPILPLYAAQRLQASPSQVGVLMGILATAAIFSRLLAGYALDRWGRRSIQIVFLALYGIVVLGYGLAPSMSALILLRLLRGIPFGIATTSCDTIASDLVPATRRGEGLGYYALAQTMAMGIGPAVALGVLADGRFGRIFVIAAILPLAAAALAWWIRHPPIRNARTSFSLRSAFERRVGWLSLIMLFIALGYGSLMSFVGLYGAELRIANAGLFFSVYAVGLLAAQAGSGRILDRRGPRWVVGGGLGLLSAAYATLALWQTAAGFFGAAFAMGLGFGAVSNSMRAMAINLVPQERRGAANGTLYSVFDIGIASGSALLGAAAQVVQSYAATYLFVAGLMLVAIVLFFVVILPRYRTQAVNDGR